MNDIGFSMAQEQIKELRADNDRLRAAVKTQGAEIDRLCELLRRALEPKVTQVTRGPRPIEDD